MWSDERSWWYPIEANEQYCKQLRKDYPEHKETPDWKLLEIYAHDRKFITLWDDTGDAYDQFEHVADMMLKLENALTMLRRDVRYLVEEGTLPADVVANHPTILGVDKLLTELKGPDYGPREKTPTGSE